VGLKDYILGRRFLLRSPLSAQEVASRIREASGNLFNPLSDGVSGWCRFGHLRLHVATPLFSNGFQPVFTGRLSENLGRAELTARFGSSLYLRVFFALWYGILLLMVVACLSVILRGELQTGYEPLGILLALAFMAIPLLFHVLLNRGAEDDLQNILEFLEEEAGLIHQAEHSCP